MQNYFVQDPHCTQLPRLSAGTESFPATWRIKLRHIFLLEGKEAQFNHFKYLLQGQTRSIPYLTSFICLLVHLYLQGTIFEFKDNYTMNYLPRETAPEET